MTGNIIIQLDKLSDEKRNKILEILGDDYSLNLSGKDKSEMLEARLRRVINETKPNTTNYDFCYGQNFFFSDCRLELKQFSMFGKSPKLQQVKPELYDKILVCAEYENYAEWWVLRTSLISSKAGKENKETGKLTLTRQHKGNEYEGQIMFNGKFQKVATKICQTGVINYKNNDLGLNDEETLYILNFVKNY